jgi:hypothetical protein
MDDMPPLDRRERYLEMLCALTVLLGKNPAIPQPYIRSDGELHFCCGSSRELLIITRRALGGRWEKSGRQGDYSDWLELDGTWHGFKVQLSAVRDAVCERVVVGMHEVTEEVPDPEVLATVPVVKVTRTVEDVRWECGSILKPDADESAPVQDTAAETEVAAA